MRVIFLHGLNSSSRGEKARWFKQQFPEMMIPDFTGTLEDRMHALNGILKDYDDLVLIGSSFGGLMATVYAMENESRVRRVFLLAPALNFPEFCEGKKNRVTVPATLHIGRKDVVCPPEVVIPTAQQIFNDLSIHVSDDDHFLRDTFLKIDWGSFLAP